MFDRRHNQKRCLTGGAVRRTVSQRSTLSAVVTPGAPVRLHALNRMKAQVRPGPGAALGAVLAAALALQSAAAQVVSVSTPQQLLAALAAVAAPGAPRDTVVELATDIALTQADAANYSLPFVIPANHSLTLRGGERRPRPAAAAAARPGCRSHQALPAPAADGALPSLQLGEIEGLLYFKPGSSLRLGNLNISGAWWVPSSESCLLLSSAKCAACAGNADPQIGDWPDAGSSPNVIQSMPLWPTLWADPGFSVSSVQPAAAVGSARLLSTAICCATMQQSFDNGTWILHPTRLCTPDIVAAQLDGLRRLAVSSGSNASDIVANGTGGVFVDWAAPVPVLSLQTKVSIGTIEQSAKNITISCSLPSSNVSVGTPKQLLGALAAAAAPGAPSDTVVELATDIALTQADAAKYSLPFVIPANHSLTLRGGERPAALPRMDRFV